MLTAYFDESGQESREFAVIAGFIGDKDAWGQLVSPWRKALGQRRSLHMHDLRFKNQSVRMLLERRAPIPTGSGLTPVHGGIRVCDYEDLLPNSSIFKKLHSGYMSALFAVVVGILKWLPEGERVELFFEQQDTYSWLTEIVLQLVAKSSLPVCWSSNGKPKLARWGYVIKGSTPLTEPADFFAFSLLHQERDPLSLKSKWCRPLLDKVGLVHTLGRILTKEEARGEVQEILNLFNSKPELGAAFERANRIIAEAETNAKKNK